MTGGWKKAALLCDMIFVRSCHLLFVCFYFHSRTKWVTREVLLNLVLSKVCQYSTSLLDIYGSKLFLRKMTQKKIVGLMKTLDHTSMVQDKAFHVLDCYSSSLFWNAHQSRNHLKTSGSSDLSLVRKKHRGREERQLQVNNNQIRNKSSELKWDFYFCCLSYWQWRLLIWLHQVHQLSL